MKARNTTYHLKQRILKLGYLKLEEEKLLEQIREEINKPEKSTLPATRDKRRHLPRLYKRQASIP